MSLTQFLLNFMKNKFSTTDTSYISLYNTEEDLWLWSQIHKPVCTQDQIEAMCLNKDTNSH